MARPEHLARTYKAFYTTTNPAQYLLRWASCRSGLNNLGIYAPCLAHFTNQFNPLSLFAHSSNTLSRGAVSGAVGRLGAGRVLLGQSFLLVLLHLKLLFFFLRRRLLRLIALDLKRIEAAKNGKRGAVEPG